MRSNVPGVDLRTIGEHDLVTGRWDLNAGTINNANGLIEQYAGKKAAYEALIASGYENTQEGALLRASMSDDITKLENLVGEGRVDATKIPDYVKELPIEETVVAPESTTGPNMTETAQTNTTTGDAENAAPSLEEKLGALKPTGANGVEAKIPGTELRGGVEMYKPSEWTKMSHWADDKNLYVVGEATSKDPGFAMQKADFDARAQVEKIAGQGVTFSDTKPIDYWTDPKTGKTFSLMQIPKTGIR